MNTDISIYIQNIQSQTDIFKKAKEIQDLLSLKNLTSRQLAGFMSVDPSYISSLLRLLTLPEIVVDGYYSKSVTATHLIILSRIKDQQLLVSLYEIILTNSLTTAQTERLISEKLQSVDTTGTRVNDQVKQKIKAFFMQIDPTIDVFVTQTRRKASVIITSKGGYTKSSHILSKISELYRSDK